MLPFDSKTQVFIVLGATDMRKTVNGLSILVADHLDLDVFTGNLFVFCNWARTIIKVLYWERNGFVSGKSVLKSTTSHGLSRQENSSNLANENSGGCWKDSTPSN